MSVRILDYFTPEGLKFFDEMAELANLEVGVGFQEDKAYDNKYHTSVAEVAIKNDYGIGVPSRPFIRNSVDLHEEEINNFIAKQKDVLLKGGTAKQVFENIGINHKARMQKEILNGKYVPNAPSTIKAKGSSKPLIDTSQMLQSVNYVVRPKGSG